MEKYNKTVITVAMIGIVLVGFWSINYPQIAYAQTFQVITGFAQPIRAMHYQVETDSIWVITEGSGFTYLYQVSRSSKSVILTVNQTKQFDDLALGQAFDIWCGKTDCYITTSEGLARIPTQNIPPNIFKGVNVTATVFSPAPASDAGFYHITGRDEVSGGFGSVTLWVDGCSEAIATCDGTMRTIDGISMQIVSTAVAYSSNNNAAVHVHDMQWSAIPGIDDNDLILFTGDVSATSASAHLRIYDLTQSPMVIHCSVQNPSQNQGYDVATNYVSAGSANNKIYVSSESGNLYVYNDECVLQQTIASADTGLSSDIRFVEYSGGRLFMQEEGANAKISQLLINSTGHVITDGEPTVYFPLPSVAQDVFISNGFTASHTLDNMILFSGFGNLWFPYTGTDKKIGVLQYGAVIGAGVEVCIDTNLDGVTDLCFTDTNNDGVPDNGQLGALGAYRSNANLTQFGTDVFCAFGINSQACTNKDIKTNGVGLTYLALLVIISYAFLVYIHHQAQTKLGEQHIALLSSLAINPILLLVMLVVDVGIAFYMGWVSNIIFYTLLVIMVGLAGFGIYRQVKGGND